MSCGLLKIVLFFYCYITSSTQRPPGAIQLRRTREITNFLEMVENIIVSTVCTIEYHAVKQCIK